MITPDVGEDDEHDGRPNEADRVEGFPDYDQLKLLLRDDPVGAPTEDN